MRKKVGIFILILISIHCLILGWTTWERMSEQPGFSDHPFTCDQSGKVIALPYRLFLPAEYLARNTERWPLLLFLHGSGQRGSDLKKLGYGGPLKQARANSNFPFIVVAPVCPSNQNWSAEALIALVDDVSRQYRVDTRRLYVTGLSMGGFGTWRLGTRYPERFAAMAPVCGGGDPEAVTKADGAQRHALRTLGIWAFHGAKDNVVKLEESERMIAALKTIGCTNVDFTIYPEAKHDAWTAAYNNPDLYEWLLQYQRE